jgi:hypothetical protein
MEITLKIHSRPGGELSMSMLFAALPLSLLLHSEKMKSRNPKIPSCLNIAKCIERVLATI